MTAPLRKLAIRLELPEPWQGKNSHDFILEESIPWSLEQMQELLESKKRRVPFSFKGRTADFKNAKHCHQPATFRGLIEIDWQLPFFLLVSGGVLDPRLFQGSEVVLDCNAFNELRGLPRTTSKQPSHPIEKIRDSLDSEQVTINPRWMLIENREANAIEQKLSMDRSREIESEI